MREATALHAGQDAETKPAFRKLFLSILDESASSDDIEELAKKLEGFQISGANQAKSSGRLGIILQKSAGKNGAFYQRTITVRREKQGWKVVDISGLGKLEAPIMIRGNTRGMRGRR